MPKRLARKPSIGIADAGGEKQDKGDAHLARP